MLRSLNMCGYLGEDSNDFCLDFWKGYSSIGPPNDKCSSCGAIMWEMERNNNTPECSSDFLTMLQIKVGK